jgi:hypothetical protein
MMNLDYNKGYAAGRKRLQSKIKQAEFWRLAFLAVLPSCIETNRWENGDGAPIIGLLERVELARDIADESVKAASKRKMLI